MKLNKPHRGRVDLLMRPALISMILAVGGVQFLRAADCHCGPACDGRTPPAAAETQGCCGDEAPIPPEPCGCFHRASPDPATLELNAPPASWPVAAEAPIVNFNARFLFEIVPLSDTWRTVQARGSPLFLLHSVLLI
jgi:hypothetical protein